MQSVEVVSPATASTRGSPCSPANQHVDAEAMWPTSTCLEFTVTVAVIGSREWSSPNGWLGEVEQVEREDGAVWLTANYIASTRSMTCVAPKTRP